MARLLLSVSPQPPRVAGGVPAVELLMVASWKPGSHSVYILHWLASNSSDLCSSRLFRLLSNNKITGLRNGSFLGLYLLEKL